MNADDRRLNWIIGAAGLALLILPWYRVNKGFFGFGWIGDFFSKADLGPGLLQAAAGRWQLWPIILLVALAIWLRLSLPSGGGRGRWLARIGIAGLVWLGLLTIIWYAKVKKTVRMPVAEQSSSS